MPLQDAYIWSVVILSMHDANGDSYPIGTAFAVLFDRNHYLVTARHVVDHGLPVFARRRKLDKETDEVSVGPWRWHPDEDVAVAALPDWDRWPWELGYIPEASFLPERPEDSQLMLGQDILFIGLLRNLPPMALEGIPMVRSGSLGRLNQKNVPLRITKDRLDHLTAHLIDCRAYQGMSGAPCFSQRLLVRAQHDQQTGEPITLRTETYLIGLVSGNFDEKAPVHKSLAQTFGLAIPIHTGVGIVTPVRFIRETLNDPVFIKDRVEKEQEQRTEQLDINTEATASSDQPDVGRTADLMSKLLQVPKNEADEVHRGHEG